MIHFDISVHLVDVWFVSGFWCLSFYTQVSIIAEVFKCEYVGVVSNSGFNTIYFPMVLGYSSLLTLFAYKRSSHTIIYSPCLCGLTMWAIVINIYSACETIYSHSRLFNNGRSRLLAITSHIQHIVIGINYFAFCIYEWTKVSINYWCLYFF